MKEDGRLGLACVERGWRYSSLDEDTFFFDERSEYLTRVDPSIAQRLSASTSPDPLSTLLERLAQSPPSEWTPPVADSETVVSLTLLGVRVDVRCTDPECARAIGAFYSACQVPAGSASPEVVVWCDDRAGPRRYLFRSRPDGLEGVPLDGVHVQTLRSQRQQWTSTLPPIPALASWPFKDRFAALHAATIRTAAGEGVLLAGDRGSGKSTTALLLSRRSGAEVLADETSFVHCRTTMVEPFPHAVGVWRDGRKIQVPITEVCDKVARHAVSLNRMIFLNRRPEGRGRVRRLGQSSALRELLPHHRDAGASIGDTIQTLLYLVSRSRAWSIEYSNHGELGDLVCAVIDG